MLGFLFRVWGLARPYRARMLIGLVAGIISGAIEPLMIVAVMFVYGAVFPTVNANDLPLRGLPKFAENWFHTVREALNGGVQAHSGAFIALVAVIPAIAILRGVFGFLNVYFLQWSASRTVADLRTRLFAHLLKLSAGFFNTNSTGQLISRVMSDTQMLQNILSGATSVIVRDPVKLIGVLGLLIWQQPQLTLIAMIVLPACIVPIAIFSRKVRRASRELQKQSAQLTETMTETFTGYRVVKAYNLEEIATARFRDTATKTVRNYMKIIRASEIPGPLIEIFGSIGLALMFGYVFYFTQARPQPAQFLQLVISLVTLYQPMKNLIRLQNQLVQARAANERAFAILATESTVPEPVQPRILQADRADIQFDHVQFSYGEKTALHDVNLPIKAGQLVALVGHSGSGKTTLSNLLLRFYDPQGGTIRIGGVDIREFTTRDLRHHIAVVTQETILFDDTIRRNIELGRPGANKEEIIAAARHAHADKFILEKPEGYDTLIGEKGVLLSGGQRQRIAIARAVLRNAPILILDEATNALDTESERAVQSALDELMKGRTTLCIAHRLSTILHADLIVVMDQGRIIETGRHDELLARGGTYKKLYELQFQS